MKLQLQNSEMQSVMEQYNPQTKRNAFKQRGCLGTETQTLTDIKIFERCNLLLTCFSWTCLN